MEMLYNVSEVHRRVWDMPGTVLEQCGMDMTSNGKGKVVGSLQREQNLLHTEKLLMSGIWEESLDDQKEL